MKKFICVFLWFYTFEAMGQSQMKAPLQEVTVYLQSARMLHQWEQQLPAGQQQWVIGGLAAEADPATIALSLSASGLRLQSYRLEKRPLRSADEPWPLQHLLDSIQKEERQLLQLKSQNKLIEQEQALLVANQKAGGPNGSSVAEIQRLAEFFKQRMQVLNQRQVDLAFEIQGQEKNVQRMRARFQQERLKLPSYENVLWVEAIAEKALKCKIALSYQTALAYWQPQYELRSEGPSKPVSLQFSATIQQNTGLNWLDVPVAIATHMPASQAHKPVINPWVLDFYEMSTQKQRLPARGSNQLAMNAIPAESDDVNYERATLGDFVREQQWLFETYHPKSSLSLGHGENRTVDLKQFSLQPEFLHYAAPRLSQEVYLLARFGGWDTLRLLPGKLNVYHQGTLINQSWLPAGSTDDTVELVLGVDKQVQLKLNTEPTFTREKRLGNTQRKTMIYRVQLKNSHQTSIRLLVEDAYPVSAREEIEVVIEERAGALLDDVRKVLTWDIELKAGEQKEWRYRYLVKYPANKSISNL